MSVSSEKIPGILLVRVIHHALEEVVVHGRHMVVGLDCAAGLVVEHGPGTHMLVDLQENGWTTARRHAMYGVIGTSISRR